MKVTRITVTAGKTIPNPYKQFANFKPEFANFKPEIALTADLEEGDTIKEVTAQLSNAANKLLNQEIEKWLKREKG